MQHIVFATAREYREGTTSEPAKRSVFQCGPLPQFPHMLVYYRKADTGRRRMILLIGRRKLFGKVMPVVQTVEVDMEHCLRVETRPFSRE